MPGANNVLPIVVDAGPTGNYVNGAFATVTVCTPGHNHLSDDRSRAGRYRFDWLAASRQGSAGGEARSNCISTADGRKRQCDWPVQSIRRWLHLGIGRSGHDSDGRRDSVHRSERDRSRSADSDHWRPPRARRTRQLLVRRASMRAIFSALGANGSSGRRDLPAGLRSGLRQRHATQRLLCLCQRYLQPDTCRSAAAGDQPGVGLRHRTTTESLIQLPSIPSGGTTTVTGSLIFGIGTQTNNGLGFGDRFRHRSERHTSPRPLTAKPIAAAIIDSGSNAYFFPSSGYPGIGGLHRRAIRRFIVRHDLAADFRPPTRARRTASQTGTVVL